MAALNEERRREIGDRLRELRAGRPQRVLSDRLGVTERTYGAWERGEQGIQWDHLEDVAAYHKVSTSYLLYGSDTRPEQAGSQLDRIEQSLSVLEDELRRLRAETAVRDAEVLRRIDGGSPTTREAPPPPPE